MNGFLDPNSKLWRDELTGQVFLILLTMAGGAGLLGIKQLLQAHQNGVDIL